mgnify:FL=1
MTDKFPMTSEGFKKLKLELEDLKNTQRPMVIKAIAEAREHGDLSENAEYHAAREKQSFIEGKIGDLESKISRAQVIDTTSLNNSRVTFGTTIKLLDLETNSNHVYTIVGVDEADIEKQLISVNAPLSKAMINKEVGDVVEVSTPNGLKEYQVKSISFNR